MPVEVDQPAEPEVCDPQDDAEPVEQPGLGGCHAADARGLDVGGDVGVRPAGPFDGRVLGDRS